MTAKRLTIRGLRVIGDGRPPAEVAFAPGLNVIVGASDTGKTFIFEALDFMLGAGDPLRRIPESIGYDRVFLEVDPSNNAAFTVRRGFDGGDVEILEFANGRDQAPTETLELSAKHTTGSDRSLSAYLLNQIDLGGRQIRKNDRGEKVALTFRHVSDLTLISEERIIHQGSPILSGQYTEGTREENLFAFFLSGQDDSQIIAQENKQKRNARLDAEANVVEAILEERRASLNSLVSSHSELADQTRRLEVTIKELTTSIVTTQDEIATLEVERRSRFEERTELASRINFVGEQLKRLRLLDDYYRTDLQRLQAVLEASRVFHELPEGVCPLCNQRIPAVNEDNSTHHLNFETACEQETNKIAVLRSDLGKAVADFEAEEAEARRRMEGVTSRLRGIDSQFERTLLPSVRTAQVELQTVIQKRTALAQAESMKSTVESLEQRLQGITNLRQAKTPKLTFDNRASTSAASEFCKVVEDLLAAWKYPRLGTVALDSDKCDLVIGGQDRANKGKGYRAVTYAAFTIGLMKYCRSKGIPHPGFVVLDTPLNPFKGPKSASADDKLTNEVKVAFYNYLADDKSGDQVIILENEEPPDELRDRINYYSFSGNLDLGRFGFFPVEATSSQEASVD
ncbi:MAG: AAA family ATPase [Planctomycetaceae bacterium]